MIRYKIEIKTLAGRSNMTYEYNKTTYSIPKWYNEIKNKNISQLTLFDVTRLIMQNHNTETAVKKAKELLIDSPICGEYYDGHLLELLTKRGLVNDKTFLQEFLPNAYKQCEDFDWGNTDDKTEYLSILNHLSDLLGEYNE